MIKAESGNVVVVRLHDGERLLEAIKKLGLQAAAILCGVGMLRDLTIAYWDGKKYVEELVPEPVELLALQGNIGEQEGKIVVHSHVVAGKKGGAALGGHILQATVHNTAEIILLRLAGVRMIRKPESSGLFGLYPQGEP